MFTTKYKSHSPPLKSILDITQIITKAYQVQSNYTYEGHPISSDNGLISQKLLLKSEFYYPLHVAMGVAYSCLKYRVFIITCSDAIHI